MKKGKTKDNFYYGSRVWERNICIIWNRKGLRVQKKQMKVVLYLHNRSFFLLILHTCMHKKMKILLKYPHEPVTLTGIT